jgi:glutaredoxin
MTSGQRVLIIEVRCERVDARLQLIPSTMPEDTDTQQADDLALYMFPTCPYCRRVMSTLDALGVEVEYRNIRQNPEYREELIEARGRKTVPVLRIASSEAGEPDEWMPESRDIEQYLADRFGDGEVPSRPLTYYLTDWRYLLGLGFVLFLVAQTLGLV